MHDLDAEWLETDGLGGFACGTVGGIRTRRYHALLLVATTPPTGRIVLVNGMEVWLETPSGRYALSAQRYTPDVVYPDGWKRLVDFTVEPWPQWRFRTEDGTEVLAEALLQRDSREMVLRWRAAKCGGPARLTVRPLLSGRDYHALHQENSAFRFQPAISGPSVTWRPYDGVPGITAVNNGHYDHEPVWYRNCLYDEERRRGLDHTEDLASPGVFSWDLAQEEAILILRPADIEQQPGWAASPTQCTRERLAAEATRRSQFTTATHRSADMYIVRRGEGKTLIAGYPWFTDWGRDTFIALRGLCIALDRLEDARDILFAWADTVSQGLLPNRFPDAGESAEYNSVDASLWYIIAIHDFLEVSRRSVSGIDTTTEHKLLAAMEAVLEGYHAGTRYGIRLDEDGLVAAGVPGVQLTWMDAKVGDWVVTPRIGKPVEVQALWLNALKIASSVSPRWLASYRKGLASFQLRFWRPDAGALYDVVDVDHIPGQVDASFRPNQIFAVGGLPFQVLDKPYAERVVAAVEERLLTPLGLRSLAPGELGYRARYEGNVVERDAAYHQGIVWPWLIGPFVEAWLRVRGSTAAAKGEAKTRFLAPLRHHLSGAGIGHVSEITDAEPPYTPRGCPFQAWSLGELIRLEQLLGEVPTSEPAP